VHSPQWRNKTEPGQLGATKKSSESEPSLVEYLARPPKPVEPQRTGLPPELKNYEIIKNIC